VTGASNKMIAIKLGIMEATVKVHLKTLLRKIDVNNRTQAAIWTMNNESNRNRGAPASLG
jgi:two-component system nitrate/nitrite response regulator NarL